VALKIQIELEAYVSLQQILLVPNQADLGQQVCDRFLHSRPHDTHATAHTHISAVSSARRQQSVVRRTSLLATSATTSMAGPEVVMSMP
jgi:hypothetical protein